MTVSGVRIGMVNFINTAPLYEIWKERVHDDCWQVFEATPIELNMKMAAGELDLGFVSSQEYAQHPGLYRLLSNLSISASGAVGSVFLFSNEPLEGLDGKQLLLSFQSQTSNSLVKIILEEFFQVRPRYLRPDGPETGVEHNAVVAIGDRALRLQKAGKYPYAFDLSEAWERQTGLPFVFAVWAVREEFCKTDPEVISKVHNELIDCVDKGRHELASISKKVAARIPMDEADCLDYLRRIEYDLDGDKLKSLKLFYELLIKRGEGDTAALPLKICD